jgi:hypothetical protein
MGAHVPHALWRAFDTLHTRVEDMDMGEITRQELDAKMDAIKSWGDVRFTEQRGYMDARFAEVELKLVELRAEMKEGLSEQSAKLDKKLTEMTRWLVGTMIALFALTITIMALMLNLTVNALQASVYDTDSAASSQAHYAPARSLHRFQRHHQTGARGSNTRRHELHAGVAQVFHPE